MRACIVGDNVTIRDNLIGTREELVPIQTMGIAETEDEGTRWLARNDAQWDLAIVDLFFKGRPWFGGRQSLPLSAREPENGGFKQSRHAGGPLAMRTAGCRCSL